MPELIEFEALLETSSGKLAWTWLALPPQASRSLRTRGRVPVRGTLNRAPFRTTLFPDGKGGHLMVVNRKLQKAAAAGPGDFVMVEMEIDTEPRVVEMPIEMSCALDLDAEAKKAFEAQPPGRRREIAKWVGEPKTAAARSRRAETICERLRHPDGFSRSRERA